MEIKDINRIALGENEILWVTVQRGNLPSNVWNRYAKDLKETLQLYFLSNRIIVTSDNINMQSIKEEGNASTST